MKDSFSSRQWWRLPPVIVISLIAAVALLFLSGRAAVMAFAEGEDDITISFHANGASGSPPASITVEKGETFTLPFDSGGMTTVLGKAKGAKAAYAVLLKYIEATIENPEDQVIFIAQSCRYPQAEVYKKMIEDKFHPKAVYINDVYPFCGINVGPGLMAAYYVGKPISDDLSAERALIEQFISEGK